MRRVACTIRTTSKLWSCIGSLEAAAPDLAVIKSVPSCLLAVAQGHVSPVEDAQMCKNILCSQEAYCLVEIWGGLVEEGESTYKWKPLLPSLTREGRSEIYWPGVFYGTIRWHSAFSCAEPVSDLLHVTRQMPSMCEMSNGASSLVDGVSSELHHIPPLRHSSFTTDRNIILWLLCIILPKCASN